ncbi:MAG: SPASM domain-containing protein, partial [bacterium]
KLGIHTDEPYPYVSDFLEDDEIRNYITYRRCLQGMSVCSIRPDGSITACPLLPKSSLIAGNIRDDDLNQVWTGTKVFAGYREFEDILICNKCMYRDKCTGGCRCAAVGYYGNVNYPDPMCPLIDHQPIPSAVA